MIVVNPLAISPSEITASNLPELDYAAYVPAHNYVLDEMVSHEGRNYSALGSFSDVVPGTDDTKWADIGATNRMSCFDGVVGTQTENLSEVTYSIYSLDIINAIGFLNVEANTITVTITDDYEGVIYERTESMADSGVSDYWDFCFKKYFLKKSLVLLDLPSYAAVTIDITIQSASTVKLGMIVMGVQEMIGNTQRGLSVVVTDHSRAKTVNGITGIIKRDNSRSGSFPIELETTEVPMVQDYLTEMLGSPALFISSEHLPNSHIFGIFKKLRFVMEGKDQRFTHYKIDIEGLILNGRSTT